MLNPCLRNGRTTTNTIFTSTFEDIFTFKVKYSFIRQRVGTFSMDSVCIERWIPYTIWYESHFQR